jgi:propionate kinase
MALSRKLDTMNDMDADKVIVVLNGGSSSLKFSAYRSQSPQQLTLLFDGGVERIGQPNASLSINDRQQGEKTSTAVGAICQEELLTLLFDWMGQHFAINHIDAIGHRVVHGGVLYHQPQRVTPEVLAELKRISPLDPDHLPGEIALIEACANRLPGVPQVACFDTAFHHGMPRVASIVPIPRRFESAGVRRFGFHGLSYEYLLEELRRRASDATTNGRVILAHLGAGASLAAVHNGRSIDTSMGFTPTSGVPMATRSGDLDPGLVAFLAATEQMTAEQFHDMVNHHSGLLGVSETSGDLRDLLAIEATDMRAAEAIALFCYQIKKWIGAFAAALGGLDTLVFAGGIGEHSCEVRQRVCEGLGFLGISLDPQRNVAHAPLISSDGSRVAVHLIHTDEAVMIAQATRKVLAAD